MTNFCARAGPGSPLAVQFICTLLLLWHAQLAVPVVAGLGTGDHPASRLAQHRRNQLATSPYSNVSLDLSWEREALLALYNATNGPGWVVSRSASAASSAAPWGTDGVSYCRWAALCNCSVHPEYIAGCPMGSNRQRLDAHRARPRPCSDRWCRTNGTGIQSSAPGPVWCPKLIGVAAAPGRVCRDNPPTRLQHEHTYAARVGRPSHSH